ncbi:G-patch domain-containing protein [Plasmodium brasilianum]|uniref:G-patch domain-containing protein n=1 Tax=Plasmodium brasilianum TaxID=5824 RepID=A0ACB9Y901_PLABR|nr:G-patch domain-containing protein [Plasmodium brasilianum]
MNIKQNTVRTITKSNIFQNVDEQEYLKPVKFVSAGFLKDKSKITEKEEDNLNSYSSDNDSDYYEQYDVFKYFIFDFNFHVNNEESDFIKNNLKKYNLIELKEKDKNFEKYGLGFKILRKMGYEDGIGKNMKTNIAPIEVQKKNIKVLEEKTDGYSCDDYDINVHKYSHESNDFIDNTDVNINNLWKKKSNWKKYWNINKIMNEIDAHLKYSSFLNLGENCDDNNYQNNCTYIHKLQKVNSMLIEHINSNTTDYFSAVKKQKETENKLKNYKNYVFKNDIYKIHLLILKNVLTYKYLLNLHTILSYPLSFNNETYNEYLFDDSKHFKTEVRDSDGDDDDDVDNNINSFDPYIYIKDNMLINRKNEKLINMHHNCAYNIFSTEHQSKNETVFNNMNIDNFEENLSNLLFNSYNILLKSNYFKHIPKDSNSSSHCSYTYKLINNLQDVYDLINIKNVEVKRGNIPLLLSDVYTFLFFIYDNSAFLHLNSYVSNFFLEFLRVYFYNNQQQTGKEQTDGHMLNHDKNYENTKRGNYQISLCQQTESNEIKVNPDNKEMYQNMLNEKHEQNEHYEKNAHNTSSNNCKDIFNPNNIKYLIHLKKIIIMGADENNKIEHHKIEWEFDNIIYFNLIYDPFHKQKYVDFFNYIKLFKDVLNINYYKKIIILFITKRIMTDVIDNQNYQLDESTLQDIENKLFILFDINKQFDISSYIKNFYTNFIFIFLQKVDICENLIKLIKLALTNNIYKKEIFQNIVIKIIYELNKLNFTNNSFMERLNKIIILHNYLDDNITFFIFKVYFFYRFTKHVCNFLRELNLLFGREKELHNSTDKVKNIFMQQQHVPIEEQKKREILTIKKKEIYETFKKVKDLFENNLMKDNSIKNIMFSILNVIKIYTMQDNIITFPVEKVLDFDKSKIFSDDKINYYFLYKDIKIPLPFYAVPQRNKSVYEINYKNNIQKNYLKDDSNKNYKFSKRKYMNIMYKLENDVNQYKNRHQDDENINVRNYIEKYCLENDILFLQKHERKVNGNSVYSINNFSIYINNNIIYIYEEHEWKPTLLSDLLNKVSNHNT